MALRRLTRGLTATFMAIGLVFAASLSPAAAAAKPAAVKSNTVRPDVDPATVVAIIKQLYSYYQQFFGSQGLTLAQATQDILDAITTAESNILGQIDAVASAQARACAQAAVINAADIQSFNTDTLQSFAIDTTQCVTLIDSLLPTVSADKAAVDTLGFALGLISPIALIARSDAGFSVTALVATLTDANNNVVNYLAPSCGTVSFWYDLPNGDTAWVDFYDDTDPYWPEDGGPHTGDDISWTLQCTAYNGNTASAGADVIYPTPLEYDYLPLEEEAGVSTSLPVTVADLPTLQTL